jgi:hypothetical protein
MAKGENSQTEFDNRQTRMLYERLLDKESHGQKRSIQRFYEAIEVVD